MTTATYEAAASRIQELTSELILCEQAERHRIAHILHDDLQQRLVAFQMRVTRLSRSLSEEQAALTAGADTLVTEALHIARTLTDELSLPVLKGEDITATLDWLVLRMARMHDLSVEMASARPICVPTHVHVLVYQLVRELLFNVVKHSGVDRADVKLTREEDRLVVLVEDGGVGFDPAARLGRRPASQGGSGLNSVKERLALLGGGLEVDTAPGNGTRMTILVPLVRTPSDADAMRSPAHHPARPDPDQ